MNDGTHKPLNAHRSLSLQITTSQERFRLILAQLREAFGATSTVTKRAEQLAASLDWLGSAVDRESESAMAQDDRQRSPKPFDHCIREDGPCVPSKTLARIINGIQRQTFHLTISTLGIVVINGIKKTMVIPQDAMITVDHTIDEERFVEVRWEGNLVTMFLVDLHARGTPLESAAK